MKRLIRIKLYSDKSVGIALRWDSEKPTKKMRLALSKFLNVELINFCGYNYTLKNDMPKEFKLIKEESFSWGVVKEYEGILSY